MTHDKILQTRQSSAHQHCLGFDKKRRILIKGSDVIDQKISYLQTSSLPLHTRSRTDWGKGSCPGYKDGLYRKAIQEYDHNPSKICQDHRAKLERDSEPSLRSLFSKRPEAWLREEKGLEKLSWNTAMTGCHRKRSCKLIGFWFLKRSGSRPVQRLT